MGNENQTSQSQSENEPQVIPVPGFEQRLKENEQGPYQKSPTHVQELILEENEMILVNVEKLKSLFEPRPTEVNFCAHFFKDDEKYIYCRDCSENKGQNESVSMCFCEPCFVKEDHKGHHLQRRRPSNGMAFCDCGRRRMISAQHFCKRHGSLDQIQVEIPQEQADRFNQYFGNIFDILAYCRKSCEDNLDDDNIKEFCQFLCELNDKSCFYNRLTAGLLVTPVAFIENGQIRMEVLDFGNLFMKRLYFYVCEDVVAYRTIGVAYANRKKTELKDDLIFDWLLNHVQILHKLAKEGCFMKRNMSCYLSYTHTGDLGTELAFMYLDYFLAKSRPSISKKLKKILTIKSKNPEDKRKQLKKILTLYAPKQTCEEKQNTKQEGNQEAEKTEKEDKQQQQQQEKEKEKEQTQCKEEGESGQISEGVQKEEDQGEQEEEYYNQEQQQQQQEKKKQQQKQERLINREREVLRIIVDMCQGRIEEIINIRQSLTEIENIQFQEYLKQIVKDSQTLADKYLNSTEQKIMMSCLLLLLVKDSENNKIVELFQKINSASPKFQTTLQFLSFVLRIPLFMAREKMQVGEKLTESEAALIAEDFKQMLLESNEIPVKAVWEMKIKKQLQFPEAGEILNSVCSFNYQTNKFVRRPGLQGNPNFIYNLFPLPNTNSDSKFFKQNSQKLSKPVVFEPYHKEIFQKLPLQLFLQNVETIWNNFLQEQENGTSSDQQYTGYTFVYTLLLIDKVLEGKLQIAKDKLEQIKNDEVYRSPIEFFAPPESIKKLLGLDQENIVSKEAEGQVQQAIQSQEKPENKIQEPTEQQLALKKKAEDKKNKMYEKLKEKRQGILPNFLKKHHSMNQNAGMEEDLCLLCHQPSKKDNQLVYLASVNQGKTIACVIHPKENKANTLFDTCFHTIHYKCFTGMLNKTMEYTCPLCSRKANCILPITYNKENKKINKICENIMVASMVTLYKVFDVENPFILLFKHIVESKGLNSLISFVRYDMEKKKWQKVDAFLMGLLTNIYHAAEAEQKALYHKDYETFLADIDTCSNPAILQIQALLAEGLWARITETKAQIKPERLQTLQNSILETEFMVVLENLSEIVGVSLQAPEPTQDDTQKQSLSLDIIRPPASIDGLQAFADNSCYGCKSQFLSNNNKFVCLLCRFTFCNNCDIFNKHLQDHNKVCIVFKVKDANAYLFRIDAGPESFDNLYINEFHMPYSEFSDNQSLNPSQFKLNDYNLNKLIMEFLNVYT